MGFNSGFKGLKKFGQTLIIYIQKKDNNWLRDPDFWEGGPYPPTSGAVISQLPLTAWRSVITISLDPLRSSSLASDLRQMPKWS